MRELIGQDLGRYHIIERLGEGGMATVFKAFDTRLEREVAVKVIRTDQLAPAILERALKRFEIEAKSVARLDHPNIVKVLDYGDFKGSPYLVMELIPGGTLKQYLKENGSLTWQQSAQIIMEIANAMSYAHKQNIIHRDIKPSNILLNTELHPILTDFGVAKVIDEETTQDLTGTSATVGTPEYMAPEQVTSKVIDHRADIYSLGVVFFEMLTGRKPYMADTPLAVLFKHLSDPLSPPHEFVHDLPESIELVVFTVLAKNPADRYQSMDQFSSALKLLLGADYKSKTSEIAIATTKKPGHVIENEEVKNQKELREQARSNQVLPRETKKSYKWNPKTTIAIFLMLFVVASIFFVPGFVGKNPFSLFVKAEKLAFEPTLSTTQMATITEMMTIFSTQTPTIASTETQEISTPLLGVINANSNCRLGPGTVYSIVRHISQGAQAFVVARNDTSNWFFIKDTLADNGCWINSAIIDIQDGQSVIGELEMFTPIPTPQVTDTAVSNSVQSANNGEPYAEVYKLTDQGDCRWSVAFRVYNVTPNTYIYLRAKDTEINCDTQQTETNYWGIETFKSNEDGVLIFGDAYTGGTFMTGWGVGKGTHVWTFTDTATNKNIQLNFTTQ